MRKDVRIGLAIGGVLLAVLIVYLLVPKDNRGGSNNGDQVAQRDAGNTPGAGNATGAVGGSGNGADAGQQPLPNTNGNNGTQPEPRRDDASFVGGAGTGQASGGTPATGAEASAQADPQTAGVDWASLLETGVMRDSLMATNAPPANNAGTAGTDPFDDARRNGTSDAARVAVGTPADKIDWGNGGTTPGGTTAGGTLTPGASAGTTGGGTVTQPPTAATPQPSTPAPGTTEYTVKQGETFSSIALSLYGDPRHYREIVKANPNLEPSRVRAGTVIKLPDAATVRASRNATPGNAVAAGATAKAGGPAIDPAKEYRVQANDSLHKISLRLYGKADRVDAIYEANKDKIGADPHRLKLDMVLKLPEAPTAGPSATR